MDVGTTTPRSDAPLGPCPYKSASGTAKRLTGDSGHVYGTVYGLGPGGYNKQHERLLWSAVVPKSTLRA